MKPETISTAKAITSALIILAIIMVTTMKNSNIDNFLKGSAVIASFGAFAAISVLNNTQRRA